jgi:prolipoprotein diacylglyceryltransferase
MGMLLSIPMLILGLLVMYFAARQTPGDAKAS